MKFAYIALFVLGAIFGAKAYGPKHDNFAIEDMVTKPEALKALADCFTDKSQCNDEASEAFKKEMPEVVQTGCSKCNERQKEMLRIFLDALKKSLPEEYEEYQNKHDPENMHIRDLLTNIQKP